MISQRKKYIFFKILKYVRYGCRGVRGSNIILYRKDKSVVVNMLYLKEASVDPSTFSMKACTETSVEAFMDVPQGGTTLCSNEILHNIHKSFHYSRKSSHRFHEGFHQFLAKIYQIPLKYLYVHVCVVDIVTAGASPTYDKLLRSKTLSACKRNAAVSATSDLKVSHQYRERWKVRLRRSPIQATQMSVPR